MGTRRFIIGSFTAARLGTSGKRFLERDFQERWKNWCQENCERIALAFGRDSPTNLGWDFPSRAAAGVMAGRFEISSACIHGTRFGPTEEAGRWRICRHVRDHASPLLLHRQIDPQHPDG